MAHRVVRTWRSDRTGDHERKVREAEQLVADDAEASGKKKPDQPSTSEVGEKLKADIDDLLDDIDEALESNAEDFVRSYVQMGGE